MTTAITTNADVLMASDELNELVLHSEIYHSFIEAKKEVQKTDSCRNLIQQFNEKKVAYDEVQRFGKYHPDFHTVTRDIRELKRKVDTDPVIHRFKEAEKALEALLDEISEMLAASVSSDIKVPTGNPFFESSCSGGCGTGGSCGCG